MIGKCYNWNNKKVRETETQKNEIFKFVTL